MSTSTQKPLFGADNNAMVALVSINLVVAVTLGLIKMIYYLEGHTILQYETEVFDMVKLIPTKWSTQPWAILTFNWVNPGFWVLITNMIWLSVFGNTLQEASANKHIFPIYFYSGLLTAFVYVLLGSNTALLGSHVGVIALALAALKIAPKTKILTSIAGGIPTWVIAVFYTGSTGFTLLNNSWQQITAISIGALSGIVYTKLLKKEIDLGNWMHQLLRWFNNSLSPKN